MAIQPINPFAPSALETEQFLGWEKAISDAELDMKTTTLKLFNIAAAVNSMVVETADQDALPMGWKVGDWAGTGWDASSIVNLPISSDLAGKVTNYAVLKVGDELVVIESVDRTNNTIDVYQRGHGGTTAAVHADEVEALITGYNYVVGVKNIEARVIGEATNEYYVAKNTVPSVKFTKEDLSIKRKLFGEKGQLDYVNSQIDLQDKDLLITMNKSLIYHWGQEATNTHPGMVVGIIAEAMTNGNINTSTGAINSVDDINDGLTASRNKGGSANVLLCGPATYDDIQKLADATTISMTVPDRLQMILGSSVSAIVTKVGTLIPVLDLNFPDDKMIALNSNDLYWAPLAGFEAPGADRTTVQESTRNNQAFESDSLTQGVAYYLNTNRNMTIWTGITH